MRLDCHHILAAPTIPKTSKHNEDLVETRRKRDPDMQAWDLCYEDLRMFYRQKGHSNVPLDDDFCGLGLWVEEQRRQYALFQASGRSYECKSHSISSEKLVKLMMLNFCWKVEETKDQAENNSMEAYNLTNIKDSEEPADESLVSRVMEMFGKCKPQNLDICKESKASNDQLPKKLKHSSVDPETDVMAQALLRMRHTRIDNRAKPKEGQTLEISVKVNRNRTTDKRSLFESSRPLKQRKRHKKNNVQKNTPVESSDDQGVGKLANDFAPSPWSVIVSHDEMRDTSSAIGNRRLHILVALHLCKFISTKNRSQVISEIEDTVQSACNGQGAFVEYREENWWQVSSATARNMIARTIRQALAVGGTTEKARVSKPATCQDPQEDNSASERPRKSDQKKKTIRDLLL